MQLVLGCILQFVCRAISRRPAASSRSDQSSSISPTDALTSISQSRRRRRLLFHHSSLRQTERKTRAFVECNVIVRYTTHENTACSRIPTFSTVRQSLTGSTVRVNTPCRRHVGRFSGFCRKHGRGGHLNTDRAIPRL